MLFFWCSFDLTSVADFFSVLSIYPASENPTIKPLFPLDPTLQTRLLCNGPWTYEPDNALNGGSSILTGTEMGYKGMKAAVIMPHTSNNVMSPNNTNASAETGHLNQMTWANHYLSKTATPSYIPAPVTNTANAILKKKTTQRCSQKLATSPAITKTPDVIVNSSGDACVTGGGSQVQSVHPRVRPVSFSLPKRSCVLLHQSAAIFIQASRASGLPEKQEGVVVQERIKDRAKGEDQQLKSQVSADVITDGMAHADTEKESNLDSKAEIQPTKTSPSKSEGVRTEPEASLCNPDVIGVEDSVISRNEIQFSSSNGDEIGAQVCTQSETEARLYLNSGVPQENTADNVSTILSKDLVCRSSEPEVQNHTQLIPTKITNNLQSSVMNLPDKISFDSLNEPKESFSQSKEPNVSPLNDESVTLPPSRPKEPFYRVQSRDGSRVLLWPSEMVSYTKISPSISYSINPLLYDFKAHNRAKEGGKDKKGRLEEESKRIKPCVIKQPDNQQRQEVMEGGREEKLDEREEDNEGGQAGNPMEVISDCNGSDTVLQRRGCRDKSTLKLASEGHLEPTPGLREMWGRRRRKRGGVRKKDRRKIGGKNNGENRIINGPFENLERGENTDKEERSEKGMLSNLEAHRMDGGRKTGMSEEKRDIQGDQIEPERAGGNDKKTGELLSDLPLNRCNRCNQLCVQVKREADQRQFQQSVSGWGQELGTLLCGGGKGNSMISPSSESVLRMPRCPAITPSLARDEMRVIKKITQTGKEEEGWTDEQQRNLGKAMIRAVSNAEENMCHLVIGGNTFPCREAAQPGPEIGLFRSTRMETACDPAISLISSPFRGAACSQTEIIPAGHAGPALGLVPCCTAPQTRTQRKIRSPCARVPRIDNEISKEAMLNGAVTGNTGKRKLPETGEMPRKKRKRGRRQARKMACALRNCMQQQERPSVQLITEIGVDEACMQDREKALKPNSKDSAIVLERLSLKTTTEPSAKRNKREENSHQFPDRTIKNSHGTTVNLNARCTSNDIGLTDTDGCCKLDCVPSGIEEQQQSLSGLTANKTAESPGDCNPAQDRPPIRNSTDCTSTDEDPDNTDTPVDSLSKGFSACCSDCTHTVHCHCKSGLDAINATSNSVNYRKDKSKRDGSGEDTNTDFTHIDHNEKNKIVPVRHIDSLCSLSVSPVDCSVIDEKDTKGYDDGDGGPCCNSLSHHVSGCSRCANVDQKAAEEQMSARAGPKTKQTDAEEERKKREEEDRERVKERQEEWGKAWVRRKEREKMDRERIKERDIDHYPEKRPGFSHTLPPHCIALHPPLLLPPSLSSSSSAAVSFHHTIVQHHLSLLPPPSVHLPVHPYPHLHPSFSPHLSPLALNPAPPPPPPPPPPLPPTFYASHTFPFLDDPGPYPIAASYHPLQSHHPSLYPPTYPAVLPLPMLF